MKTVRIPRVLRKVRAAEIAQRVMAGEKPIAIAHEIGVHVTTVYAWVRKARNG